MLNRRETFKSMLALGLAPSIIRTPGLLMPIKQAKVWFIPAKLKVYDQQLSIASSHLDKINTKRLLIHLEDVLGWEINYPSAANTKIS